MTGQRVNVLSLRRLIAIRGLSERRCGPTTSTRFAESVRDVPQSTFS